MKSIVNTRMKKIFDHLTISDFSMIDQKLPEELKNIIDTGIEEVQDLLVFKMFSEQTQKVSMEDFQNHTGVECFINKLNLDDYDEFESVDQIAKSTLSLVNALQKELEAKHKGKFVIISSIQEDDFLSASVRFHKKRNNEQWVDPDKIDDFEEEAVAIFEVGN